VASGGDGVTRWLFLLVVGCEAAAVDPAPSRRRGAAPETTDPAAAASADVVDAGAEREAGPTAVGCKGLPVCEDFEESAVGTAPAGWKVVIDPPSAGTVAVDDTRSVSGKKSVKVTFQPQNVGRYAQISKELSFLTANAFFGRMRLWVNYAPSGTNHWEFLEAWGYVPGSTTKTIADMRQYAFGYGAAPAVQGQPARAAINAYYLSSTCDCFQQSAAVLPQQKWSCVEWQFDGVSDQMHFWLDGQSISDLTVVDPQIGGHWPAPKFEEIRLGWYGAPSTPVEMWIDDVAIASQRIGCGG
jgi:hypothetical protein